MRFKTQYSTTPILPCSNNLFFPLEAPEQSFP
jgi:hypothetical protein